MNDSPLNERASRETADEADAPQPIAASRSPWVWLLALLVAAALAAVAINYAPRPFVLPDRLSNLSMNSPLETQLEAADVSQRMHWQNSLIGYGLAGACFGLASIFVVHWQRTGRAIGAVIGCTVAGVACGMLAVAIAYGLSTQFAAGGFLHSLAADDEALLPDVIIWVFMSIFLALPAGLALLAAGARLGSQKVLAVPLAGLLTGLLMPIGISLLIPAAKTSDIPPHGWLVTGAWMAVLAVFLFLLTTFTGSKQPKPQATAVTADTSA